MLKNTKTFAYGVFCVLASITGTAYAQQPSPAQVQQAVEQLDKRFAAADTNKDGCVTKDEANGKMPRVYKNFEMIDKDKKGCVTLQQIKVTMQEGLADMKAKKQN
jgi:Ca2+-binding EF-hand superfamily protein